MDYETAVVTHNRAAVEWLMKYLDRRFNFMMLLDATEFEWIDGQWTLDGMEPTDWYEAMLSD